MLREQIAELEKEVLAGTRTPHTCRFCFYFACQPEKCKCGCNQVHREKALIIERLKHLAQCVDDGEVPQENESEKASNSDA
jgi:hypothetical protein